VILTVTLNTAIDKAYTIDSLKVGQVIRVKEAKYTAGGKGLNVTRVVNILGEPVLAMGFSGGYAGKFVESELDRANISHHFVRIEGETRSCVNIIDNSTGVQTELLEPGPTVNYEDVGKLIDTYKSFVDKSEVITLSGSALNGIRASIYQTLIEIAQIKGKIMILDTSGRFLVEGIKANPTLIKPNISEAQYLLGTQITNVEEAKTAAKRLAAMGTKMVAISLGINGAVVATKDEVYYAKAPDIKVLNTVGCGDAMVAGFAVALARGYRPEEMLRLGIAVSTANAMTIETGSCKLQDIEHLLGRISVTAT